VEHPHQTYIAGAKRFYSKWSGIDVFRYNTMPETELRIMIHTEVHYASDIPTSFLYVPLPILDVLIQALLYHLLYIFWGEFSGLCGDYNTMPEN